MMVTGIQLSVPNDCLINKSENGSLDWFVSLEFFHPVFMMTELFLMYKYAFFVHLCVCLSVNYIQKIVYDKKKKTIAKLNKFRAPDKREYLVIIRDSFC